MSTASQILASFKDFFADVFSRTAIGSRINPVSQEVVGKIYDYTSIYIGVAYVLVFALLVWLFQRRLVLNVREWARVIVGSLGVAILINVAMLLWIKPPVCSPGTDCPSAYDLFISGLPVNTITVFILTFFVWLTVLFIKKRK